MTTDIFDIVALTLFWLFVLFMAIFALDKLVAALDDRAQREADKREQEEAERWLNERD